MTRFFKKASIAAAALALVAAPAFAGNLDSARPEPKPVVASAAQSPFTGFYAGLSLGAHRSGTDIFDYAMKPSGATYGLQAGYWHALDSNIRLGAQVGVEGFRGTDTGETVSLGSWDVTGNARLKRAVSARVQAGYVVTPEAMPYAFIGYKAAKGSLGVEVTDPWGGVTADSVGVSLKGPLAGIGVAYQLNSDWSLFGEYEYARLKASDVAGTGVSATFNQNQIRVGVNYRF